MAATWQVEVYCDGCGNCKKGWAEWNHKTQRIEICEMPSGWIEEENVISCWSCEDAIRTRMSDDG